MSENLIYRILLIEDNAGDARLIQEMLADISAVSFHLKSADTLSAALAQLSEEEVDLILLDLSLTDSHGIVTLEKTLEVSVDIPIVVLTGLADDATGFQCVQAGAQDFVTKGQIDSAGLFRCIGYAIERKRIAKQLRQSEERLRKIIDRSQDGIAIVDNIGVFLFVNPAAEELFGRKSAELMGQLFGFPVSAGTKDEIEIIRSNGRVALAEVRAVKIDWEGSNALLLTMRDITEAKKTAEELQQAQKFESISILAGGIAHDFNNLLGIIMGYIELARLDLGPDSSAYESLATALKAVVDAKNLTRRLIEISRRAKPEKHIISMERTLVDFIERAGFGGDKFELSIEKDLWTIEADEGQIRKVFFNLFENAREAIPEGGIIKVVAKNIMIEEEGYMPGLPIAEGRYVKISVQDEGRGIQAEYLPMIFDPYYSTKGRGSLKGMGLGLTTAYSILKNHQGYIHVDSKVGKGTRVDVYLPAAEDE